MPVYHEIIVVDQGTVIEYKGDKLTVTDDEVVYKGLYLYVTKKVYDAIKAKTNPTNTERKTDAKI